MNTFLQISSDLMVLKSVSTTALKLLYLSSGKAGCFWPAELAEYLAHDVAFEAANDFPFALPIFCSFSDIGERGFMASHPDNRDTVKSCVGLPVSASV